MFSSKSKNAEPAAPSGSAPSGNMQAGQAKRGSARDRRPFRR